MPSTRVSFVLVLKGSTGATTPALALSLPTWVTAKAILASQDSETMRVTMIL